VKLREDSKKGNVTHDLHAVKPSRLEKSLGLGVAVDADTN
jgi:hypothetical protein